MSTWSVDEGLGAGDRSQPRDEQGRFQVNTRAEPLREPNVEAGAYIEDDPRAWEAWTHAIRRYVPEFPKLAEHLGTDEAAVSVLGGTILSYLADQHNLYLVRGADEARQRVVDAARDLTTKEPRGTLNRYRWNELRAALAALEAEDPR